MPHALWDNCIENLSILLDKEVINNWLRPLDASIKDNVFTLHAPNKFVLDEVKKNLMQTIELVIKNLEPDFKVEIVLQNPRGIFDSSLEKTTIKHDQFSSVLNPEFTFNNYVEGSSNQIAAKSALGIANKPDGTFNPLLIYGSTGLGKSHLMHAIGNHIKRNNPRKKVVYQTAEQFVSEMVNALSNGSIDDFKKRYHLVDVLLVDDVQFIGGKGKSQEEFFHIFNNLLSSRNQVVLTCDKYPKEVENLEERLKSRFGAGLSVAVEPPDLETRCAILKKKASLIDFELADNVAFFIAEKVKSHVRELEGALNSVFALSQFNNEPASIQLAKTALRDILSAQLRQVNIDNIQKVVANYYNLKISDLKSKSRRSSLVRPRQIAMAISKQLTNLSLPDIGNAFDRDHSTVIHAIKKVEELKKSDPHIKEDYTNLVTTLTS